MEDARLLGNAEPAADAEHALRTRIDDTMPPAPVPEPLAEEGDAETADSQRQSDDESTSVTTAAPQELIPTPTPLPLIHRTQDSGEMPDVTLEEVLEFALNNHPVLCAERHELDAARARLVTACLLPNPELVMDTETPVYESGPTELTTRVTFTIPLGGKRQHRKAVAKAGICRARMVLSREAQTVLFEASDAAIEVLYQQELLQLRTELAELAAQVAARIAESPAPRIGGQLGELDITGEVNAEINAATMETRRLDTEAQLAAARVRLARAVGLGSPIFFHVRGTLIVDPVPLLPLQTVLAMARHIEPELEEARWAVDESCQRHALAHAEAKPDLIAGPRYQDRLGVDDDRIGARVAMELPLLDRNQGAIQETAAEVRASRARLDVAELNTLGEIAAAYTELASLGDRLQFYGTRVHHLLDHNESLITDPQIRRTVSDRQILQITLELTRMQLRNLELRHRYHSLLKHLELALGRSIVKPVEETDLPRFEPPDES